MGRGGVRRSGSHTPSPPLSPMAPVEREGAGEEAGAEPGLSEQQQAAMQQEERVLTEQIESLQKEKEELTYEMLVLEPRASDDETLESEASIGTADSSENLTLDPEGATSDPSDRGTFRSTRKSDGKSRRTLRRQPDSMDSVDSSSTASSSISSSSYHPSTSLSSSYHPSSSLSSSTLPASPHYRFRSSSSGPLLSSYGLGAPLAESEGDPKVPAAGKSRHRLRLSRSSPREPSDGHRRDADYSSPPQQLVLYGSNEFMV